MPSSRFVPLISSLAKPSENIHLCHSSSSSSSSSSCRCLTGGVHTGVQSHSHTHIHTQVCTVKGERTSFSRSDQNHASTLDHNTLKQTLLFVMLSQRDVSRAGQAGLFKKRSFQWQKHKISLTLMFCNWHHLGHFPPANSQWAQRWTKQELPDVQELRMRLIPWMKRVNPSGCKSQQRWPPGQTDSWRGGHHAGPRRPSSPGLLSCLNSEAMKANTAHRHRSELGSGNVRR